MAADNVIAQLQRVITDKMNPFLYYTLVSLVEGPAYTILEQVEEENGF